MILENEQKVYDVLKELGISYTRYEHKPVYTIEELDEVDIDFQGTHCKNLFVRNKKGDIHYLIVVEESKKVDLKKLAEKIGSTTLSFASEERLLKNLGLKPGSVSPFGVINNEDKKVKVIIDKDLSKLEYIGAHPNVNTATVVLSFSDLEKFLKWCKNDVKYIEL
ncbi:prolyl-tRNA synthetase associated domain-containing protein [Clostridium sp. A1-XYC3]|uniref:Prolyl-tRNA synthetase associated domain-containing protein n=1 Tax=Clostridium tanneri TaxID=3037988 RepID=A0ABU4JV33_9CLOT|nr:prolyl-tRNA synthetase associated domain-containing protein [Clostridium sp. A1-XYC3]MDW8801993.1 prolyl-tRNA synthetase associated domain-containing protein [Clostridium sp. A1-XYC3]